MANKINASAMKTAANTNFQSKIGTPAVQTIVPSTASTSAAKSIGDTISGIGSSINNSLDSFLSSYLDYANQGATIANAESRAAQERQFAFNSAEAALERQYNSEMWDKSASFNSAEAELQRAFNAKEAQIARQFNAEEAEKNRSFNSTEAALNRTFQSKEAKTDRDWQERMANTAYQREVADLKAAGLNPILAALNSGAATGTGAMAAGSQASGSAANGSSASGQAASTGYSGGSSASGSNYTGQGHNMSEALAMIGAIGSMIGAGASAFGAWMNGQDKKSWIKNGANFLEKIGFAKKADKLSFGGKHESNGFQRHDWEAAKR